MIHWKYLLCKFLFLQQRIIAEFSKVECIQVAPDYVQFNCELIWPSKNISALNINFTFSQDVEDLYGQFNLRFHYGNKIINYTNLEMDFCTILQTVHATRLIQSIAVRLRRASNLPMKCPFKMASLITNSKYTYFPLNFFVSIEQILLYWPFHNRSEVDTQLCTWSHLYGGMWSIL